MASFNKIVIVGYLGKDPEVRYAGDGAAICNFSMATTEKSKRNGEWQEQTTWFKVTVFGKQAEVVNQYLTKGSQAYVEGRLSLQEYIDRDGNKRTSLEVKATDVQFLDRKPQGDDQPASSTPQRAQPQSRHRQQEFEEDVDPNIPF